MNPPKLPPNQSSIATLEVSTLDLPETLLGLQNTGRTVLSITEIGPHTYAIQHGPAQKKRKFTALRGNHCG